MKKILISLLIFELGLNTVFAQTRCVQWKDLPNKREHVFPLAYINGSSNVENKINNYLQERYLNGEESYRDSFYEYVESNPTANICGVSITYEHEFNTAPGIYSFTDLKYFDLRSGEKLVIDQFFHENGQKEFLEIMNERKNSFVNEFRSTINKEQEDYEKLIEIVEYTIKDNIDISDIDKEYHLSILDEGLILTQNWEYAWEIGRHNLPNIVLGCSYQEIESMLNDYGKSLLLVPRVVPENKLLYGYIGGKYNVSALVRETTDSIKITYWYESNRKPINWTGKIKDKVFLLTEKDVNSVESATVELSFYLEQDKIRGIGKWYDIVKKKTLTIELFEH